jgi:hypothetical protein
MDMDPGSIQLVSPWKTFHIVLRRFWTPFSPLRPSNEKGASLTCQDASVILPYGGYLETLERTSYLACTAGKFTNSILLHVLDYTSQDSDV